jgi:hypothetical protein
MTSGSITSFEQFRRVIDPYHAHVPGRAQAFLENGGAQRILVDDGNAQIPAQRSSMGFMDAFLHVAGQGMFLHVAGQGMIFARGSWRLVSALHPCRKVAPGLRKKLCEIKRPTQDYAGLPAPSRLALSSRTG